jgi:hypothetical protein
MCCRVALVRTDVSEAHITSIVMVKGISELRTTLIVTILILFTLMMEAIRPPETSVLRRATRRHISEGGILHSHRCENLKSYKVWLLFDDGRQRPKD